MFQLNNNNNTVILNERSQYILKTIIECYIRDGEPIGSRMLSRESQLALSPATIRNTMADLEELELVFSPHTSSGRIPTSKGYRFFIDSLLNPKTLSVDSVQILKTQLDANTDPQSLLTIASQILSEISRFAGVVMVPRRESRTLSQIEFLPLSENRVLAVLVINECEIQNRIIYVTKKYSISELQQAANYLNSIFKGKDLYAVRWHLIKEMAEVQENVDQIIHTAMEVANQVFSTNQTKTEDCVVTGQTNLLDYIDFSDKERLRQLFNAFNEKQDILHLLDQCLNADGIQIFVGEETGYQVFNGCSVVTARYGGSKGAIGVLGIIGPIRMDYEQVIPLVDITAQLLGNALNQHS
ncbi:heat-inducible transcriptional repressor HrcA [Candidatus Nitrosacidococcus sp. I8]|uniref:heat-inducible transcriptional repressor HrcA n=1 Tax=Candidatus Nitrosacidococcus sp. I8 TaxID=2942908 RepID=UPI0022275E9E|nr:heat-inducible transcriptional repressor HrcA [Candidatus Nitrosacidococcus sp. I8]CAH9015924.1 Heat-inducible transcription repressor HrcA [Candidatus Nitrosacidococcus sp. I8]